MLQGKYIKYSPEITFEVFQKIWDKLIEDGWKEYNDADIKTVYDNFISEQGVITYSESNTKIFSNYLDWAIVSTDKELTLSEIFGRKLTEFPIEGCCKTIDPLLINFLNKKYLVSHPNQPKHFQGVAWSNSGFCWYLSNVEKSSKPLYTFEELEPFIDTEEYVKVINNGKSYKNHPYCKELGCNGNKEFATNGKIYKVIKISKDKGTIYYALDYNGDHYLISKEGIEPSTKEEYDKQFKIKVKNTVSRLEKHQEFLSKFQQIHSYYESGIFPKYSVGIGQCSMFNSIPEETFPQPIFLKEDEIVKTKQINQIKELKFLNIK